MEFPEQTDQEFNEECPYCESGDIEVKYLSGGYDTLRHSVSCRDCGKSLVIYAETKWFIEPEDKNDD